MIAGSGVKTITAPAAEVESFHRIGESVRQVLIGKLYDQSTLDQVLAALQEYRAAHPAAGGPGK